MVCQRCKGIFRYDTKMHRAACNRTPTPDQLVEEWETDRTATCQSMADKYRVTGPFMRDRMKLAGFSKQELNARGHVIRIRNSGSKPTLEPYRERWKPVVPPRMKICRCGVLISSSANKCLFCRMDDSGIHNVYQLVGEAEITAPSNIGD